MKNLRAVLDAADPLRDEPALATVDAREMRRRTLGAVETAAPLSFPRTLPVAALVALMIVAGMAAGRRFSDVEPMPAGDGAAAVAPGDGERRQVQFATPGGTRIIWTIDPNFQMRGMP
jgi:hypothetical protein